MTITAKLFKNGRSQAVRLPLELRFEDVSAWFAELDRLAAEPFMPEGRERPPTPRRAVFDDDAPA